jgi:hypothetical protein
MSNERVNGPAHVAGACTVCVSSLGVWLRSGILSRVDWTTQRSRSFMAPQRPTRDSASDGAFDGDCGKTNYVPAISVAEGSGTGVWRASSALS